MDEYYYDSWLEDGTTAIGYRRAGWAVPVRTRRRKPEEVKPNEELPTQVQGPVTRTDIVKYAAASWDFNPIHHDEVFARQARSGGIIAHGMMVMGYLGRVATAYFGTADFDRFKIRLLDVTRPGDTLRLGGRVTGVARQERGVVVTLALRATRATGEVVAEGEVVATLTE
ncbi:MAG TPA: MaoC family dehydratase [Methylomirabilota bacterium]|nr:MaoC family dehydratase [Methylomirabilota bacterium]